MRSKQVCSIPHLLCYKGVFHPYHRMCVLCSNVHTIYCGICSLVWEFKHCALHTHQHPTAHRDVEAPAAQAISIPANSMPSCSTYISTAIIHAIFAIPCPPQHHTQAMQPDLKSVCACRKAANSSHRSCSPTCTASGSRQRVRALQADQMLKRQHRFCHKAASG